MRTASSHVLSSIITGVSKRVYSGRLLIVSMVYQGGPLGTLSHEAKFQQDEIYYVFLLQREDVIYGIGGFNKT